MTALGRAAITASPSDRQHEGSLVVGDEALVLIVRRNPRARRLTLRLATGGDAVVVTIPHAADFAAGVALAQENLAWIAARLADCPARVPFEDGQVLPLRGLDHRIRHRPRGVCGIMAEDGLIHIDGPSSRLASRLGVWLRAQARADLTRDVMSRAVAGGRPVGRISVRDTRSRWGSCAANGNLSFSWRLILAPSSVLAYVVAHELAHLAHRNHGPRFWAEVAAIAGNVSASRAWLKRHGPGLHRYG